MSTSPTPTDTAGMSKPTPRRSPNSAAAFWCGLEGAVRSRQVVIEFADYETALACYRSPEYQAALRLREGVSIGDLVVAEGVAG
jgi:hypothetical protein